MKSQLTTQSLSPAIFKIMGPNILG